MVWCNVLQVIYEVPPGQAPDLVGFVSVNAPSLASSSLSSPSKRALTALLAGCLRGLRVELTTAPKLAAALEGLLAGGLGPLLTEQLLKVRCHCCAFHQMPSGFSSAHAWLLHEKHLSSVSATMQVLGVHHRVAGEAA